MTDEAMTSQRARSALDARFQENFTSRGELGAAVSLWKDGEEIHSLAGGHADRERERPWTEDTLVPVWSATKGPAAFATLLALAEAGLSPRDRVSRLWPELRAASGSRLTFAQLLSHQSGLPALSPENRPSILQHAAVIRALEKQEPFWAPGKAHGYHPRTIGFLADEVVRRCTGGTPLGQYWREKVAEPLGLDFWIGDLPRQALERVARILPPKTQRPSPEEVSFYQSLADPGSLPAAAFASPAGMRALSDINRPEFLQAGIPSLGGVGSARALAKFYSYLATRGGFARSSTAPPPAAPSLQPVPIPPGFAALLSRPASSGPDRVLQLDTAFAGGFMRDPLDDSGKKTRHLFGPSATAFGQPGAGGSHAFADPETGSAFAYVMNQMEGGVLPNEKSLGLVEEWYNSSSREH